jgi:hypothetical protein
MFILILLFFTIGIDDSASFRHHAGVVGNAQGGGEHGRTGGSIKRVDIRFLVAHVDRIRGAALRRSGR